LKADVLDALHKLVQRDAQVHPRQAQPCAGVWTRAEREMPIVRSVEVEAIGQPEPSLVAVG
jgi:hypothetical protein